MTEDIPKTIVVQINGGYAVASVHKQASRHEPPVYIVDMATLTSYELQALATAEVRK